MNTTTLPVEGWEERCASYAMTIVRSVVTQLRDGGPLGGSQVRAIIKRATIGADVAKASPFFNDDDGAERILNFIVADIDEVVRDGDTYSVAADTRVVRSKARGFTVSIPAADEAQAASKASYRTMHLRAWAASRPFQNVWRNGLREHTDDEIIAMADWISAVGYLGDLIVRDQNGVIINGHFRVAALSKLGMNVEDFTQEVVFTSEFHRLSFVIAAHWPCPAALRDAVKKMVNKGAARTGVKFRWSDDLPLVCAHGQTVLTAPAPVAPVPALPAPTSSPAPFVVPSPSKEQIYVERDSDIYKVASWLRDHPGSTSRQITDAVKGVDYAVTGTITAWKRRGLIQEIGGGPRTSILLELSDKGRALLAYEPPPVRAQFRKGDGYVSGPPGSPIKVDARPRASIVQRLISASERGKWVEREDMEGGVKFAHVLRKWMWFHYEGDGNTYLFIPNCIFDRPARTWKRAQVRRLTPVEADMLGGLLKRGADEELYETWERLVRVEHQRLFG